MTCHAVMPLKGCPLKYQFRSVTLREKACRQCNLSQQVSSSPKKSASWRFLRRFVHHTGMPTEMRPESLTSKNQAAKNMAAKSLSHKKTINSRRSPGRLTEVSCGAYGSGSTCDGFEAWRPLKWYTTTYTWTLKLPIQMGYHQP